MATNSLRVEILEPGAADDRLQMIRTKLMQRAHVLVESDGITFKVIKSRFTGDMTDRELNATEFGSLLQLSREKLTQAREKYV